jgi:hypothetical protein
MEMRKRGWRKGIIIAVAALVMGALALNGWALSPKEDKDTVLVTVEDVNITRGDVDHKIDTLLASQGGRFRLSNWRKSGAIWTKEFFRT